MFHLFYQPTITEFIRDIFQGAGVLQYHPGALVEAGFQWILIGSNDLHRFWGYYYVGHAVNIKNTRGSS